MKTQAIAEFLSAELIGNGDVEIDSIAALDEAGPTSLTFATDVSSAAMTSSGCVIIPLTANPLVGRTCIKHSDPKLAFAKVARLLLERTISNYVDATASIHADAKVDASHIGAFVNVERGSVVGGGTVIHNGVRIGANVSVGTDCVLHPNVVVYDNSVIGDRCIIHAGAVIGAPGFGYVKDDDAEYIPFPQIGRAVLENNVEIGANTCIDRGALGETRIGRGTKIDNLVQIAHNVQIGKRVVIAAQTGISGSTVVEDDCVVGGQVGMGDHARVRSGAIIGSQAGVLPGKIVRAGVWWGTPVQPLDEYKKQNALVKGLARLKADVKDLKRAGAIASSHSDSDDNPSTD